MAPGGAQEPRRTPIARCRTLPLWVSIQKGPICLLTIQAVSTPIGVQTRRRFTAAGRADRLAAGLVPAEHAERGLGLLLAHVRDLQPR